MPLKLVEAKDASLHSPWGKTTGGKSFISRIDNLRKTRAPISYPALVFDYYIKLFQRYISPVDGARCQFYPTCSHYGRLAFSKHGAMLGFVMTADRLMRGNAGVWQYYPIITKFGRLYYYDPLEANDFWFAHSSSP